MLDHYIYETYRERDWTGMPEFKKLTLADRLWMEPLLRMSDFRSEEYNFNFCYIWRDIFQYQVARHGDFLLLKSCRRTPTYLYPPGSGDVKAAIDILIEDARQKDHPFLFHTVLAEQKALLEVLYPGGFQFMELGDYFDYVYDAQSLITLAGKKLHSKRNHIHRFEENNPGWSYEGIAPENMPEVIAMSEEWCRLNDCKGDKNMRDEACAVHNALQDYFSLGMDGGLIRADGRVVAFSMGERLNSDTYLVHIEKAFGEIQGAYAIINREFAARNCQDFLYINREDDSGEEGLRKAKLSYRPVFLVEKYAAKLL